MFHRKKEEDTASSKEERNQFIREQVRPQRKKQVILWMRRFVILVVAACIFGAIAGGMIVLIENYFAKPEEETAGIGTYASNIPEQAAASEEPEPTATSTDSSGGELSLSKVDKISQRLAAVGNRLDASLVGVKAKSSDKDWLEGRKDSQAVAYGLVLQETGVYYYILTTCNIIQGQNAVTIQLLDDTTAEGVVLGSDKQLNIAIVRVRKSDIKQSILAQMSVAQLANGMGMLNGTNIIAIGCPNGILRSVVTGQITNDSVRASITDGEVQLYCTDIPYAESGNGVVLDIRGRVIGILTTDFTEKTGTMGMSFVRLSGVIPVLELLQQKKNAPYMGIEGITLSVTVAKAHQLDVGAYVTEVYTGSPAYEGGMRVADVVTKIDDTSISSMIDFYQELLKKQSGDTVTCTVSRTSGKKKVRKELEIKLD